MKLLLIVCLLASAPAIALAGGANVKTGKDGKNGKQCAPGFYYDGSSGLCVAANWI